MQIKSSSKRSKRRAATASRTAAARSWWVMRWCFYLAAAGIAVATSIMWNTNMQSYSYYNNYWPLIMSSASLLLLADDQWDDSTTTTTTTTTTKGQEDSIRNSQDDEKFEFDDFFFDRQQQDSQQNTNTDYNWKGYQANRTIALIHVGKAGGLTIRRATSLLCRLSDRARNQTEAERQPCIDNFFDKSAVLARQVHYYFHMHGYRPDDIRQASSFLFVLRNPMDRIVSTYKYSHPANCNPTVNEQRQVKPWGCNVLERSQEPGTKEYKVYSECFPSAAMEAFAQSIQSPFVPLHIAIHSSNTTSTSTSITNNDLIENEQNTCRSVAHSMVTGKGPIRPAPHMYYNYAYYTARTTQQYPHKTVFGIRTDHEWDDIQNLDKSLGGTGRFRHEGWTISHGSEHYQKSPLSPQAYQKLCCVLHEEIVHYRTLLQQVVNFNATVKRDCMQQIRTKCAIPNNTSFAAWRQQCQRHLQQDTPLMLRYMLSSSSSAASVQQQSRQQQSRQQNQRQRQRNDLPSRVTRRDNAAMEDRMRQRLDKTLAMMKQNDDVDVDDVGDVGDAAAFLER